jgi:hypothetical protein
VVQKLIDNAKDVVMNSVILPKEWDDEITDRYISFDDSVGEWGGTCECPSSSNSYLVGSY